MLAALALAGLGWFVGRRANVPAASLLGPLALTGAWAMLVPDLPVGMPGPVREAAFALIGLAVGLRFTAAAIRRASRLAPVLVAAPIPGWRSRRSRSG